MGKFKMPGHTLPGINQRGYKSKINEGKPGAPNMKDGTYKQKFEKGGAPKLDVLIDGENIGSGADAYAKGRIQEVKSRKAADEAFSSSPGTTEKSKAADRDRIAKARKGMKKVEYTGKDAYKRIDDSNMSPKEKQKARDKVASGKKHTPERG
tara:strand:+ start:961 stop:1416 length:456 start_codon:yes stop_codon:yes gene_type:complete